MQDFNGFYKKYNIYRRNPDGTNGAQVDGPTFTLRPHDPHALVALKAYADSVRPTNPLLAEELDALVASALGAKDENQA